MHSIIRVICGFVLLCGAACTPNPSPGLAKKYKRGTVAVEEHRYGSDAACTAAALRYYFSTSIDPKQPLNSVQTSPLVYSWRDYDQKDKHTNDIEVRFISVPKPPSADYIQVVYYYRINKVAATPKQDIIAAVAADEFGTDNEVDEVPFADNLVPDKYESWRAVLRGKKTNKSSAMDQLAFGIVANPPYPP
jgi:hypothetical protein